MTLLLTLAATIPGILLWRNAWPPIAMLRARVTDHNVARRGVASRDTTCPLITPVRQEERETARAWFGCIDLSIAKGDLRVCSWMVLDKGRCFSRPTSPVNLTEDLKWNR